MSRNRILSITSVVQKLKETLPSEGASLRGQKYTIDGDKTSIEWLDNLIIDNKIRLFPDFYSAWVTCKNENYLVLVNCKLNTIPNSFLQEKTLNSGTWIAIIDELKLSVQQDKGDLILEILESEWEINNKGYKELNFEKNFNGFSLQNCFPSIYLYKIISKFTQKETLNQITGIVLTVNNSYCLLPYTLEVLQEFGKTFENGNKYIPFENILESYVASDFKFAYLDLYRCIERLQPLYFFKSFYDKLELSDKSLEDFYIDFYESTKLEPKLENSLNELLKSININYQYANKQNKQSNNTNSFINDLKIQLKDFSTDTDKIINSESTLKDFFEKLNESIESIDTNANKQNNNAGSYLYKLRNQIVHLRPKQKNDLLPKSFEDWNLLILDMLRIVQALYEVNQNLLNETDT